MHSYALYRQLMPFILLGIVAGVFACINTAVAAEEAPKGVVYLPFIAANPIATPVPMTPTPTITPTATVVSPTPDAETVQVFVDTQWKSSNASIKVDDDGGLHTAYYYYEPRYGPDPDGSTHPTYAVYLTCVSQCNDGANWSGVSMGEGVNEVQLAVTADGKPRVLYRTWESTVITDGRDYVYAACDHDCTDPVNWREVVVASSYGTDSFDVLDDDFPQRSFALDPQGRPRFVYLDRNYVSEPDHYGLFYMACEGDCTNAANWTETQLTEVVYEPFDWELVKYPSLAFTPDGGPRLVSAEVYPLGEEEPGLTYFSCDSGCDEPVNWARVRLADRGQGSHPSVDIAVDSAGRPRLAFYQEAVGDDSGQRLYYLWCDHGCLDAVNWQQADLGLDQQTGRAPDLALDAAGHPHIAYLQASGGGLGYAWCDDGCNGPSGWSHRVVEDGAALAAIWPVAHPPHCDGGLWDGATPNLVLDANGAPWVAYDARYHARCWYDDDSDLWEPDSQFHLIMRAVRIRNMR